MSENIGLQIDDAFIVLGSKAITAGEPSSLTNSHLMTFGYVPRWARRGRLRPLRPTMTRLCMLSTLWRWTAGRTDNPIAIQYGPRS